MNNITHTNQPLTVLWWGRFDPDYSRNRLLRRLMREQGCRLIDFHPRISGLGHLQAGLQRLPTPDLIWVPCFRQRDIIAAAKWGHARNIPLIFDPLISAWDKQVFERKKFPARSPAANKLLRQEQQQFGCADIVIADTDEHARFFAETFAISSERVKTIHVGADETLFKPEAKTAGTTVKVLFYGSFIHLQNPQIIIEAARLCQSSSIEWTLLGNGPLLEQCKQLAAGLDKVHFEDWLAFEKLPRRIHQADILLGVFGASDKAARVIPNKVYQSLACARPVVTRISNAYPKTLENGNDSGLFQIPPADDIALADQIMSLAQLPGELSRLGHNARESYNKYFSNDHIKGMLSEILDTAMGRNAPG